MHIGDILLDRYTLTEIIGEGGMGVVYRAADQDGAEVAIKRLHSDVVAVVVDLQERPAERVEMRPGEGHHRAVTVVSFRGPSRFGAPSLRQTPIPRI